ncbi:hypothetical protein ABFX02_06G198900 [Erythranthe guttata]
MIRTDTGSRLLLTSRYRDITKHARYVHDMKCLDPDESLELLLELSYFNLSPELKSCFVSRLLQRRCRYYCKKANTSVDCTRLYPARKKRRKYSNGGNRSKLFWVMLCS